MKTTNDLKKGTRIKLRNGWDAKLEDNAKGNTRLATVFGNYTEMGSVYGYDIMSAYVNGEWHTVQHTDKQNKCRKNNITLFGF